MWLETLKRHPQLFVAVQRAWTMCSACAEVCGRGCWGQISPEEQTLSCKSLGSFPHAETSERSPLLWLETQKKHPQSLLLFNGHGGCVLHMWRCVEGVVGVKSHLRNRLSAKVWVHSPCWNKWEITIVVTGDTEEAPTNLCCCSMAAWRNVFCTCGGVWKGLLGPNLTWETDSLQKFGFIPHAETSERSPLLWLETQKKHPQLFVAVQWAWAMCSVHVEMGGRGCWQGPNLTWGTDSLQKFGFVPHAATSERSPFVVTGDTEEASTTPCCCSMGMEWCVLCMWRWRWVEGVGRGQISHLRNSLIAKVWVHSPCWNKWETTIFVTRDAEEASKTLCCCSVGMVIVFGTCGQCGVLCMWRWGWKGLGKQTAKKSAHSLGFHRKNVIDGAEDQGQATRVCFHGFTGMKHACCGWGLSGRGWQTPRCQHVWLSWWWENVCDVWQRWFVLGCCRWLSHTHCVAGAWHETCLGVQSAVQRQNACWERWCTWMNMRLVHIHRSQQTRLRLCCGCQEMPCLTLVMRWCLWCVTEVVCWVRLLLQLILELLLLVAVVAKDPQGESLSSSQCRVSQSLVWWLKMMPRHRVLLVLFVVWGRREELDDVFSSEPAQDTFHKPAWWWHFSPCHRPPQSPRKHWSFILCLLGADCWPKGRQCDSVKMVRGGAVQKSAIKWWLGCSQHYLVAITHVRKTLATILLRHDACSNVAKILRRITCCVALGSLFYRKSRDTDTNKSKISKQQYHKKEGRSGISTIHVLGE